MRKGFTLIEVMLAAAILGIGALGVLGMLTTVIRQNGVTQDRTAATYLAESVVTRIELGAKLKWSAPAGNTDYPEWGMVRKAETSPGTWLSATHQVDKTGVVSSDAANNRFRVSYYVLPVPSTLDSIDQNRIYNGHSVRGAVRIDWSISGNTQCTGNVGTLDSRTAAGKDCDMVTLPFAVSDDM